MFWHRCFPVNFANQAYNFINKETLAQVFSCEFCKISKNTFSCVRFLVAASWTLSRVSVRYFSKNTISFRMNIIFFGDAGDVTLRCMGGDMSCLWRLRIYAENTIFHALLIKIISFHFPPKEKISYFLEERNTIFPDITKKNFLERPSFQNI